MAPCHPTPYSPTSRRSYTDVRSPSTDETVDLDLLAEVQQWFEEMENDPFADLPGYQGFDDAARSRQRAGLGAG
jgi:hypothetical protein